MLTDTNLQNHQAKERFEHMQMSLYTVSNMMSLESYRMSDSLYLGYITLTNQSVLRIIQTNGIRCVQSSRESRYLTHT